MAEPPAKRARRTDSSAMWDANDQRQRASPSPERKTDRSRHGSSRPEDSWKASKDDRRYRSRSRDRPARRRESSRSRERYDRTRDRDGGRRDLKDSRSKRDRDRSLSADRYQSRRGHGSRADRPDRSRSPRNGAYTRSRSPPSRGPRGGRRDDRRDTRGRPDDRRANGVSGKQARVQDEDDDDVDLMDESEDPDDIDAMMRKAVGFTRFKSTKNTKIPGNDIYGVRKETTTQYRQYMNRTGGFNRPLSPGRS